MLLEQPRRFNEVGLCGFLGCLQCQLAYLGWSHVHGVVLFVVSLVSLGGFPLRVLDPIAVRSFSFEYLFQSCVFGIIEFFKCALGAGGVLLRNVSLTCLDGFNVDAFCEVL